MKDWISRIKKGDVLKSRRSGTLRIVRRVTHYGGSTTVYFLIRHCSWTHRCFTMYSDSALRSLFEPTRVKMPVDDKFDALIQAEIDSMEPVYRNVDCCDVKGMP